MASPSSRQGHQGVARTGHDSAVLIAAAVLGITGFLMHIGPVYRGGAATVLAAQPVTTWVGAGGIALLLGGLLSAAAARPPTGAHPRDGAAVFSVLGTLAVVVGLLDPPMGAATGWALIVIAVLAVLQTALTLFAAVRPAPNVTARQPDRRAVQQQPAPSPAPTTPVGYVSVPAGVAPQAQGRATGSATNQPQYTSPPWVEAPRHVEPADRPTAPVYTPQPSPAGTGAQPIAATGSSTAGVWAGRAQQAGEQRGGSSPHAPEGFTPGQQ